MIDAQARVPRKGVPEIIPKSVDVLVWMKRAKRVGPSLVEKVEICGPNLWREQRIVEPALGLVDVEISRHHVEIAREEDGLS